MKTLFGFAIGVAVFVVLGNLVPGSHFNALVVPALGNLGAFSYRFLASVGAVSLFFRG